MMQSGLGPGRTRQRSQADGSEPGGMEGRLANSSFPLYAASRGLRVTLPTRLGRCQLGIHAISPSRANFLSESESHIVITEKKGGNAPGPPGAVIPGRKTGRSRAARNPSPSFVLPLHPPLPHIHSSSPILSGSLGL